MFWNNVDFLLTLVNLDKLQKSFTLARILKVIQASHTVCIVLCPVTRTSIAYKLIIFRPSTTNTMPLTTQIVRTATKWFATHTK